MLVVFTFFAILFCGALPAKADILDRRSPFPAKAIEWASSLSGNSRTPALETAPPPVPAAAPVDPIEAVVEEFRTLPGSVSFRLEGLGPSGRVLGELNPGLQLGIGSTFKLYILAALSEDRRPWDEVVRLKSELMSFPSGILHRAAPGSPMTVWGLAGLMISLSDNTATDHLLQHAGRRRVEEIMALTGHSQPGRNRPMLSTLELFKLKAVEPLRARYEAADEAGRRSLLDGDVAALPRKVVSDKLADWTKPIAIETAEWFASAADLCRLMEHFSRRNDAAALNIMNLNTGLRVDEKKFSYAGFKGGSEPGVINLLFLLRGRGGGDFALSAAWNDPRSDVDNDRFLALVQRVLDSIPAASAGPAAGK